MSPRSTITIFESQRPRVRREYDEPMETAEYTWNFTADQFDIFKNYVEINLENGQNSFEISGFEGGLLVVRNVAFLNLDMPYNITRSDNLFVVVAQVEVVEDE